LKNHRSRLGNITEMVVEIGIGLVLKCLFHQFTMIDNAGRLTTANFLQWCKASDGSKSKAASNFSCHLINP